MAGRFIATICSNAPAERNRALEALCRGAGLEELHAECAELDDFRRHCDNLYQRVRALFFLYALHRFYLPPTLPACAKGWIPVEGFRQLLARRFEEAIDRFLAAQRAQGPSETLCSALAQAYRELGFQTLANQVRRSVRAAHGNQWMFRIGHPLDQPLRIRPELLRRAGPLAPFPVLSERTPVRMDLSHSAWSDIFFLGMDYPEGARVLNVSIDLAVRGRDREPRPPVETYLRVIDQPVLRLVSVDLGCAAEITELAEVFDFGRDYLGLLKAAVIAAGLAPPGLEGSAQSLAELLARLTAPGLGLEIVSKVNDIPKGSRLAVSTTLLASLIALCMRATGQAAALRGAPTESERRVVAARAILGEWLAGSGGGWQDSGGIWPGMKLISGAPAAEGDPEYGVSRGRLLPNHRLLGLQEVSAQTRQQLQESLVLVHGGMAQNVGPILEMVTEKYLLRLAAEWQARGEAMAVLDRILAALRRGDVRAIARETTHNFRQPIQTIIPAASNLYTETLIARTEQAFGADFWGFWMLGGMSGGGMGFILAPRRKAAAQDFLGATMRAAKDQMRHALPFAMEPVVYDFAINERGTWAELREGDEARLPPAYYALMAPSWIRTEPQQLAPLARRELEVFSAACLGSAEHAGLVEGVFRRLLPQAAQEAVGPRRLAALLEEHGFDREQHEQIQAALRSGRIGLAQNRLPAATTLEDVRDADVLDARGPPQALHLKRGREALAAGQVAVVTLAAGAGSRWTQGAGVVKALHPFCRLGSAHRSFLEVHLAKSRRTGRLAGAGLPHVITTGYLTHEPIAQYLAANANCGYAGPLLLSPGRAVGLRLVPMVRDLRFAWEQMPQQLLDEQQQKLRDSLRAAFLRWARAAGEGSDYTDNLPFQCLHPVGHWYEIPNLLRNGVLNELLRARPGLKYLLLHNIDTVAADVDPALLGRHMETGKALSFEVIGRRVEDRGGGLARVDGRVRLVEGLALPREEDELALSYYNTMTTWIDLDRLLALFGLGRADLSSAGRLTAAIREVAARMPTYVTLKDVKKRWGHGQEDIYPLAQFEKLWSDMTALPQAECAFFVVPRLRGQQLKEQAQLDGWRRDGSAAYVESLCEWA